MCKHILNHSKVRTEETLFQYVHPPMYILNTTAYSVCEALLGYLQTLVAYFEQSDTLLTTDLQQDALQASPSKRNIHAVLTTKGIACWNAVTGGEPT